MLKNLKKVAALAAVVLMMTSCALTLPVNATSNEIGSKVGTAKAEGFLGVLFL